MIQVLHTIKMRGGEQVELLATPALFGIAKRKGLKIEANASDRMEVYDAYMKLIYLAALNAWEVRRWESPAMGECPYTLMDFVQWASSDVKGFSDTLNFILCALTGKELKDYTTEEVKASETGEKSADSKGEDEDVKKKSSSTWIMRLFRRS